MEQFAALAASAARLFQRIQREAREARAGLVVRAEDTAAIRASDLTLLPEPVAVELVRQTLVQLGCGERNLTQSHYRSLLNLARRRIRGKMLALPGGFAARREGDDVVVCAPRLAPASTGAERYGKTEGVVLNVPGSTRVAEYTIEAHIFPREQFEPGRITGDKSRFEEYLDLDRVRGPVVVRARRAGDRFTPLGLVGDKRVGKFLTAAKVPWQLRERVLIFADDEKILWVCPIRIGDQVKVRKETQRILALKVNRTGPQREEGDPR